jgi:hypothetical protein
LAAQIGELDRQVREEIRIQQDLLGCSADIAVLLGQIILNCDWPVQLPFCAFTRAKLCFVPSHGVSLLRSSVFCLQIKGFLTVARKRALCYTGANKDSCSSQEDLCAQAELFSL